MSAKERINKGSIDCTKGLILAAWIRVLGFKNDLLLQGDAVWQSW